MTETRGALPVNGLQFEYVGPLKHPLKYPAHALHRQPRAGLRLQVHYEGAKARNVIIL
jgi:hypothetical protein